MYKTGSEYHFPSILRHFQEKRLLIVAKQNPPIIFNIDATSNIYMQKGLKCDWGILLGYNYEQPLCMKLTKFCGYVVSTYLLTLNHLLIEMIFLCQMEIQKIFHPLVYRYLYVHTS